MKELTGGYTIKYHANGRIDVIRELENLTKMVIPSDLPSLEARVFFSCASVVFAAPCPAPGTTEQLWIRYAMASPMMGCLHLVVVVWK
ncbi:unnamed protein product [Arabis nemorensis]|uniref:Uncharacterized protein n=1 Tax=Arabis nemorensis TaxID=586526 RepID=A0A565CJC4_9BRAS|nr:unnamed protein product [Arabis nemorensis]